MSDQKMSLVTVTVQVSVPTSIAELFGNDDPAATSTVEARLANACRNGEYQVEDVFP
jgi:hypothetical protein